MPNVLILRADEETVEQKNIEVNTIQLQQYIQYHLRKESFAILDGYINIWYGKQHPSMGKNTLMVKLITELDDSFPNFKQTVYGPIIITFHKVTLLHSFSHEYPELLCHFIDIPFTTLSEVSYAIQTRSCIPMDYTEQSYDSMKNRMVWSTPENDILQNKLLQIYMYNKRCELSGVSPKKCTILNPYLANLVLQGTLSTHPEATCPITMNLIRNEEYVYIGSCGHIVGPEGRNLVVCPLCRHPCEWLRVKNSVPIPFHKGLIFCGVCIVIIGILIHLYI